MIKITKRLSVLICSIILVAVSSVTFFAQSTYVLADDASIFSQQETTTLSEFMQSIGEETGWQIIVHTSNDNISSDNMETYYNNTYYDGQDFEYDSVMLVIDNASNNRIILTHGTAMEYFDDDRMTEIKSRMRPYLSQGDMYNATLEFLNTTEEFYSNGITEDGSYDNVTINENYEKQKNPLLYTLSHYGVIIGVVAVIAGGVSVLIVYLRYKDNGKKGTYDLNANSVVNITDSHDEFLNKTVTVRTDPPPSSDSGSSSSGGGGGSSHGSSGSF